MAYISRERKEKLKQEVKELFDRREREEREKREKKERIDRIALALHSNKTTKTYKDYAAERKTIVTNLADAGALPKTSRTDYPKARFAQEQDIKSGYLRASSIRVNRLGNIKIK